MKTTSSLPLVIWALGGVACDSGATGFAWEVTLQGAVDECNDPAVDYTERFQYVLDFVGSDVTLKVGQAPWARGTLAGCTLEYESPVWVDDRRGRAVSWQIQGEATLRQGGGACGLEPDVDWDGFEVITVLESDDPEVPVGCRFSSSVVGTFEGEL